MSNITVENLTATPAGNATIDYVWYNNNTRVFLDADDAPTAVLDSSLNQVVHVSNASGPMTLTQNGSTDYYTASDAFDLFDTQFSNLNGDPYLTSYINNYKTLVSTNEAYDLSMINTDLSTNGSGLHNDYIVPDLSVHSGNKIVFDLDVDGGLRDVSNNAGNLFRNIKTRTTSTLRYLPTANVSDISNNMLLRMNYFGIASASTAISGDDVTRQLSVATIPTNPTSSATVHYVDISVNALSDNTVVKFTSDSSANTLEFNAFPTPNILYAGLLPSSITCAGAGRRTLRIPVTIPANSKAGAWNYNVVVEDSSIVSGETFSQPFKMRLAVLPEYSAPSLSKNVSLSSSTLSDTIVLRYNNADYNQDILDSSETSGGLKYQVRLVSNKDDTMTNTNVAKALTLKINGTTISGPSASDDQLGSGSITRNLAAVTLNNSGAKSGDISANILVTYTNAEVNILDKSYTLHVDWLNKTGGVVGTVSKTITITPTWTNTVQVRNNYDGTYNLSYANAPTLASPGKYRIKRVPTSGSSVAPHDNTSVLGANTYYGVIEVDPLNTGSWSIYNNTRSNTFVVNSVSKPQINYGLVSDPEIFDPETTNVVVVDANGNIQESALDISGYHMNTETDGGDNIAIVITRPSWFDDMGVPTLFVTATEHGGSNLKGMDISGNASATSLIKNGNVFSGNLAEIEDISNNIFIDMSYNAVRLTTTRLSVLVELKAIVNGAAKTIATRSAEFFIDTTVVSNPGATYNNFVTFNDCKWCLNKTTTSNIAAGGSVDTSGNQFYTDSSANVFKNFATSAGNMYNLNLMDTQFLGEGHTFDISSFKIDADGLLTESSRSDSDIKAYIPFSEFSAQIELANGDTVDHQFDGKVSGHYSTYPNIFVSLQKSVGYFDIHYNTMHRGKLSVARNTMRVHVLPRPTFSYTARDASSNILPNTETYINHTATNAQYAADGTMVSVPTSNPALIFNGSTGDAIDLASNGSDFIRHHLTLNANASSMVSTTDQSLFSDFLAPANIRYGGSSLGAWKFAGRNVSVAGPVTYTTRGSYTNRYNGATVTKDANFKIVFALNDNISVVAESYVNNLYANSSINLNNIELFKYHIMVPTTDNADFDIRQTGSPVPHPEFENVMFLILENTDTDNVAVVYAGSGTITMAYGARLMFTRTSTTEWGTTEEPV
jgi:hypothetical protein